jgi:hypothetical protein
MQHEAAAKINRTHAIPPSSQGWNTHHRSAEVQAEDLKDTNVLVSRLTRDTADVRLTHITCRTKAQLLRPMKCHTLHRSGQEPVQLRLAKATESGVPQPFLQWRSGDRSGRIRRINPRAGNHTNKCARSNETTTPPP